MQIAMKDIEVKLDHDDWECVVDTAGYGIGYWAAGSAPVDDEAETYTITAPADDFVTPHPHATGTYEANGEQYQSVALTKADLEQAIALLITGKDGNPLVNDEIRGWISSGDLGNYDATVCDCIVQVALFGQVVYG